MEIEKMSDAALEWHIARQKAWKYHYQTLNDFTHVKTCKDILRRLLAEYAKRGIGK